jgi:hypothetical protein
MTAPVPQVRLSDADVERARGRGLLSALVARRVKLRRAGRSWRGPCPFHGSGPGSTSFSVVDAQGFFHCFGCGEHGDAIDWLKLTEGLGFREAVLALLGGDIPAARRPIPESALRDRAPAARPAADVVSSATAGRWIWRTAGPARGELAEKWLEARGCDPRASFDRQTLAIDHLRFHPRCPAAAWRADRLPEDHPLTAPALVAPVRDGDGLVRAVHVTFLSADGRRKADFPRLRDGSPRPARKMFGRVAGCAVWLTPFAESSTFGEIPLVVGEGLETTWSFAQGFGRSCRAAAVLSLGNLQGGARMLRGGALPLWNVEADPERAPFTVAGAGEVIVLVDADMKPLKRQKVQLARGEKPVRADISGLERARICAALASQHWRRAGAAKVTCVRPKMGMDFNDAARAERPGDASRSGMIRSAA